MGKIASIVVIFLSFIVGMDAAYAAASAEAKRNLDILRKTGACVGCDLAGLDLTRMDLAGTNLQGADLSFSICNLASFSMADLRGAKFRSATLHGVDMGRADLRGADFTDTAMDSVFLAGALMDDSSLQGDSVPAFPEKKAISAPHSQGKKAVSIAAAISSKTLPFIAAEQRKKTVSTAALEKDEKKGAGKKVPQLSAAVVGEVKDRKKSSALPGEQELHQPPATIITITADKKKRRKAVEVSSDADGVLLIRAIKGKRAFPLRAQEAFSADQANIASSTHAAAKDAPKMPPLPHLPQPVRTGITPKKSIVKPVAAIKEAEVEIEEIVEDEEILLSSLPASDQRENPQLLQLLKSKKCYDCDLSGLDLSGQSLAGADLEGANLTGCNLQGADLRYANLKAAQLIQAKMQQAKLDGADLYKANLSFANLSGASTAGADFDHARLKSVVGLEKE